MAISYALRKSEPLRLTYATSTRSTPHIRTPQHWTEGRVAACTPSRAKYERFFTAVTPHNPSIPGLRHDHPSSVARQQRKKPDPWPPQATWALKIALLGADAEHVPRGALEELRHSTLLLRPLSVLCSSHLQVVPRLCGGIDQHVCSPTHIENIGP